MPVSPLAVAAMLACARIGAVHMVVFAGFSSEALAGRIQDGESTSTKIHMLVWYSLQHIQIYCSTQQTSKELQLILWCFQQQPLHVSALKLMRICCHAGVYGQNGKLAIRLTGFVIYFTWIIFLRWSRYMEVTHAAQGRLCFGNSCCYQVVPP